MVQKKYKNWGITGLENVSFMVGWLDVGWLDGYLFFSHSGSDYTIYPSFARTILASLGNILNLTLVPPLEKLSSPLFSSSPFRI